VAIELSVVQKNSAHAGLICSTFLVSAGPSSKHERVVLHRLRKTVAPPRGARFALDFFRRSCIIDEPQQRATRTCHLAPRPDSRSRHPTTSPSSPRVVSKCMAVLRHRRLQTRSQPPNPEGNGERHRGPRTLRAILYESGKQHRRLSARDPCKRCRVSGAGRRRPPASHSRTSGCNALTIGSGLRNKGRLSFFRDKYAAQPTIILFPLPRTPQALPPLLVAREFVKERFPRSFITSKIRSFRDA